MEELKKQIRQYIAENFLFTSNGFTLSDDTSFLDEGVIDSTGTLELILFLEQTFQIVVEDHEIIPSNLDSVNNLVAFIERENVTGQRFSGAVSRLYPQ